MLDSIARQDEDGPRDGETTIEQRLPDGASGVQGFEIASSRRYGWQKARDQARLPPSAAVARSNAGDTEQAAPSYVRADCRRESQMSHFPTAAQPIASSSSISLAFSGERGNLWYALFEKGIYPRFSFIAAYGDRGHSAFQQKAAVWIGSRDARQRLYHCEVA